MVRLLGLTTKYVIVLPLLVNRFHSYICTTCTTTTTTTTYSVTTTVSNTHRITNTAAMSLKAVDFEVFGRVHGVFFRKYTKQEADKLGLRGWCLNTSKGTVLGHMQGPNEKIESMMQWLKTKGSPSSQINKAEFKNQKDISNYEFNSFDIRKDN